MRSWTGKDHGGRLPVSAATGAILAVALASCATPRGGTSGTGCPPADPSSPLLVREFPRGVAPGATDTLHVARASAWSGFEEVPSCRPRWTLSPGAPAEVAPRSGVLRVRSDAPHDAVFTAYADLGGRVAETRIHVVDPRRNPLVGRWHQVEGAPCDTSRSTASGQDTIRELEFRGDGTFQVTWLPFESYADYWGRYAYDADTGRLRLEVTGGNHVPDDVEPDGRAVVAASGDLTLSELSLGSPRPGGTAFCRATFRR